MNLNCDCQSLNQITYVEVDKLLHGLPIRSLFSTLVIEQFLIVSICRLGCSHIKIFMFLVRRAFSKKPTVVFPEQPLPTAYEELSTVVDKKVFKNKKEMERTRQRTRSKIYSNKGGEPWFQ